MTDRRTWTPAPAGGVPDGTILYDGVCVLCSGFVRFVAARDGGRYSFVPVQSPWGAAIAARHGIAADFPETNAVVLGGTAFFKSDAALAVLGTLPGWGWTGIARVLPRAIRHWLYDRIARNRYSLFGRTETCPIPPPSLRARVRTEPPGPGSSGDLVPDLPASGTSASRVPTPAPRVPEAPAPASPVQRAAAPGTVGSGDIASGDIASGDIASGAGSPG